MSLLVEQSAPLYPPYYRDRSAVRTIVKSQMFLAVVFPKVGNFGHDVETQKRKRLSMLSGRRATSTSLYTRTVALMSEERQIEQVWGRTRPCWADAAQVFNLAAQFCTKLHSQEDISMIHNGLWLYRFFLNIQ
jgi:hypothetical protein